MRTKISTCGTLTGSRDCHACHTIRDERTKLWKCQGMETSQMSDMASSALEVSLVTFSVRQKLKQLVPVMGSLTS